MSDSNKSMSTAVKYDAAPINAFRIAEQEEKTGRVTMLEVDGRKFQPTSRFWTSLCSSYSTHGLSMKLFKLFTHAEVFQRLTDRLNGKDRIRYAFEDNGNTPGTLLAITNPTKAFVPFERVGDTLAKFNAKKVEYSGGIVRSTHSPAHMADFQVGGDEFAHEYVMETPIDGFGQPLIYLSLLRQVCSNGAIGYCRAFRTELNIGKGGAGAENADVMHSIERALDSFSNEEGYAALRQRFDAATNSWASIAETNRIYKVLDAMGKKAMFREGENVGQGAKMVSAFAAKRAASLNLGSGLRASIEEGTPTTIKIMRAYTGLVGDLCAVYGLTHIDALTRKKMQQLPSYCSMYDLINFATEVATHYCTEKNGRLLQAELGNFLMSEYDLENTRQAKPDFADWFVRDQTTGKNVESIAQAK